jgi:serine phosphatase RsbU (regulator of sigma subunit)
VLVGWLLHDATRRAINRARVESALTLDRQVVVRMQRALLPTRLPKIEGVELEVRYRPGDLGATGGDWYAAIPLADRRVGLAVGEVEGEGVQAAARMAEVGFVLRGIASLGDAPDSVLEQLNQQLFALAGDTEPMHVSAIYGILDTDSGEWEYAMAGSCPPLLRGADAAVQTLEDEPASALGVDPNAKFHTTTVALSAGSTLLLYTNGLLERADEVTARDLQRLSAAFKVLDDDLTDGVDRLVRLMVGDDASEDSVVVAARVNKVPAVSTPG